MVKVPVQRIHAVVDLPIIRHACGIPHPDAPVFDDAERIRCRGIVDEATLLGEYSLPTSYGVRKEDVQQLCSLFNSPEL
jgi:hypothetical protein